MSTTSTVASTTYTTTTRHTLSRRNGRGGISTASTPNLNQVYTAHSSRLGPQALSRKGSVAALTQTSLASIPDDSEAYAYNTVLSDGMPSPLTPGRFGGGDVAVGDVIDVPGNMSGTIRFIGAVSGRKGTFVGVELLPEFAGCGKNSGDVDSIFYFRTKEANTGIFLPISKAVKREAPAMSSNTYPLTPASAGLKAGTQNSTNFTPPTPGVPKFSQSVGPVSRAASPMGKKPTRPSLPRPESPVRRMQMTPAPRPSIGTTAAKTVPPRYDSSASNRFAQSVRGTVGDPSKRLPTHTRKGSVGPRSVSVLGVSSSHHLDDDDTTPLNFARSQMNGSTGSASAFNLKVRPASRAASRVGNYGVSNEEVERLKAELEERDRQLKEQASTLAEMESSLTELQGLIESSDGPLHQRERRSSIDDKDAAALRAVLREKNEKIALLTAEFDAHRADFRSTIDTLEMASTETERVYEKKIEELMQEIQDLQDRTADVDTVANQLKQLEELVQELEEGLEDARRGEAEARGEVEFLRGEVERTRSELRREREKAQSAMNGANGSPNSGPTSKELEQKEDEIRGLKAIIHSLSRDSVPNDNEEQRTPAHQGESIDDRLSREKLEREVAELRALVESKSSREETLERELETLRRGANAGPGHRGSAMTVGSANDRNSYRDSRGTVVLAPRSPEAPHKSQMPKHSRANTLDTMPESDSYSTATETSTLWCEICETSGHDILTCTNVFGSEQQQPRESLRHGNKTPERDDNSAGPGNLNVPEVDEDVKPAPLSPIRPKPALTATVTPVATQLPTVTPVHTIPNPMESGPVAGKESGVVDASKWCALCERDGHDSVDCPFEDAF
ncbi:Tip elongation protein 1 [Podospora australis]|uniref:Tip elongation protein 1 n=1 Tax=Podospora australis TaxID=1536484 RepID=A0AAN7AJK5_9PEZI|nr:Tip elongation protein 1 [Podospora australis]